MYEVKSELIKIRSVKSLIINLLEFTNWTFNSIIIITKIKKNTKFENRTKLIQII